MCSIILKIKAFVLFNSKICLIFKITSISFFIVYLVRHHSHAFFKHVFNYLDLKFLFSKPNIFRDSIYWVFIPMKNNKHYFIFPFSLYVMSSFVKISPVFFFFFLVSFFIFLVSSDCSKFLVSLQSSKKVYFTHCFPVFSLLSWRIPIFHVIMPPHWNPFLFSS